MKESWCIIRFFQTHETEWGRWICSCVLVRVKRFGISKWLFSEKRFAGDLDTGCCGASMGNHRTQGSKWVTEWWNRIIEVGHGRSRRNCQEIADLQSYTHRIVLCISNPAWPETPDENTDNLVLQLSSQLNVNLQPWEISRSHRVEKPQPGKIRPIWVKFIGYCFRERLFKACKLLKGHQTIEKVYINKDLTTITNEIAYTARQLMCSGAFAETFISDCEVFLKKFASNNIVLI